MCESDFNTLNIYFSAFASIIVVEINILPELCVPEIKVKCVYIPFCQEFHSFHEVVQNNMSTARQLIANDFYIY